MQINKNYEDTVSWIDNIFLHHLTSTGQRSLNKQEQQILDYTIEKYDCIFKALKSTINDKEFLGFWCSQLNKLSKQIIQDLKINYNIEIKGEDLASLRPLTSTRGFELARDNENKAKDVQREKSITEKTLDQLFHETQTLTSGLHREIFLLKSEKTAMDKFVVTLQELNNSINRDLFTATGKTESLTKDKTELQGHNRALNKLVLDLRERITQVEKERLDLCRQIRELKHLNEQNLPFVPNPDIDLSWVDNTLTEPEKEIYIGTDKQKKALYEDIWHGKIPDEDTEIKNGKE